MPGFSIWRTKKPTRLERSAQPGCDHAIKARGIGVLVTDHSVQDTLAITDRAYVIFEGRVLVHGTAAEVASSPLARRFYLGERFRF